jgi:hypothetical protein
MNRHYLLILAVLTACSSTVRPVVLNELAAVAQGPSAQESKELVPQAYLRAEKLRQEAEAAADAGKNPVAEVKAERAIAAYERAQILARIVKAEQRLVAAKAQLTQAQTETLAIDARRITIAAELKNLDAQVQLEHETEAIAASKTASPEREASRKAIAQSTLTHARLLCVTAELLDADKAAIDAALKTSVELEAAVAKSSVPTPLNEIIKLRSRCLEQLTLARRPARLAAPNSETSDRLFLALSQLGLTPVRDERGIVVTLPPQPTDSAVLDLARLATDNVQTPLLIISHRMKGEPSASDEPQALANRFTVAGVKTVRALSAGARLPLESALNPAAAKLNERVEVVFVTKT